ncbi:slit homolog 1 protein-like [Harmonia axyridis]|uniref:slit homolog 1 protein-like n=1 Tax=Harmonia axyridis TaxID=115357 RepID=UPI001E277D86|nr:slit homolog 1 protein-like [Harmonia axyridis]
MKIVLFLTLASIGSVFTAECNISTLTSIDAITVDLKGRSEKLQNSDFFMMDSYKVIFLTRASVPLLCEGMVKFFSHLEELYIIAANVSEIEQLAFQDVPKLTKLSLAVNKLRVVRSKYFNQIKSLEVLYLSSNELEQVDEDAFDGMSNLTRIYFNRNNLRFISGNWFKDCPSLKVVDLSHNKISTVPAKAFLNIVPGQDHHAVQYRLRFNEIESISPEALEKDKDFLDLMLDNNKLTELPVAVFKNLQVNSLVLSSNRIACLDMEVLEGLRGSFMSLHLERNPLACDCVDKFEEFANNTEIQISFYYSTTFNCKLLKQMPVLSN